MREIKDKAVGKNSRQSWLPRILFSLLLPIVNILGNSQVVTFTLFHVVVSILISGLFLLILWTTNENIKRILRNKNSSLFVMVVVIIFFDVLYITAFLYINQHLIPREYQPNLANAPTIIIWIRLTVVTIAISSIQFAIDSIVEANKIKLQYAELQTENLRNRIEVLRQQINPHFLFNALGTLRAMIRDKENAAEDFVIKLGELYRKLLNRQDLITVTLAEEISFLEEYSFLLTARFQDALHIHIEIPNEWMQRKIPGFSFQLLVENAVKHNTISYNKPLHVTIKTEGDNTIVIENNLQLKTSVDHSSGIGLQNLATRYQLLGISEGLKWEVTSTAFIVKLLLIK